MSAASSFPFAMMIDGEAIPFDRIIGTEHGNNDGMREHFVIWETEAGIEARTPITQAVADAVTALQFEQMYIQALVAARETFFDMRFSDSPFMGRVWAYPIGVEHPVGKYFDRWFLTCTYSDDLGNPAYDVPTDVEKVLGPMVEQARTATREKGLSE